MSKSAIIRVLAIYFVAAIALSMLKVLGTPGMSRWRGAIIAGDFVGTVIGFLLLSGFLPLVYWAVRRFRVENAFGVLSSWGILGAVFVILFFAGALYDGSVRFTLIPQNIESFASR